MSFPARYAILLDGAFVNVKLRALLGRFPAPQDIVDLCESLKAYPDLGGLQLLRSYFYHSPPARGKLTNPLDKKDYELGNTSAALQSERLLDTLEMKDNFALRLGHTKAHGGRLGPAALDLCKTRLGR